MDPGRGRQTAEFLQEPHQNGRKPLRPRWFDVKRFNFEITHNVFEGGSISLPKDDKRRVIQIPEQAVAIGLQANPR